MEKLYKNIKTIAGFLVITFVVQTFAGEKVSSNLLMFVLFSMIILNADKLKTSLDNAFVSKEEKEEKR